MMGTDSLVQTVSNWVASLWLNSSLLSADISLSLHVSWTHGAALGRLHPGIPLAVWCYLVALVYLHSLPWLVPPGTPAACCLHGAAALHTFQFTVSFCLVFFRVMLPLLAGYLRTQFLMRALSSHSTFTDLRYFSFFFFTQKVIFF